MDSGIAAWRKLERCGGVCGEVGAGVGSPGCGVVCYLAGRDGGHVVGWKEVSCLDEEAGI